MAGLVVDGAAQVRMLGQVKRDALCGNSKCTLSQARAELSNDDGSRGGGNGRRRAAPPLSCGTGCGRPASLRPAHLERVKLSSLAQKA